MTTLGGTILLVNDEEAVRRFSSRVLEKHGLVVAGTGPNAIAAADGHARTIDLPLTDVMMPGMNGCELGRPAARATPVPARTVHLGVRGRRPLDNVGLLAGAAFLGKPFKPKALVTKVREVLDAPAATRSGSDGSIS